MTKKSVKDVLFCFSDLKKGSNAIEMCLDMSLGTLHRTIGVLGVKIAEIPQ